jgi:hypothetical protein
LHILLYQFCIWVVCVSTPANSDSVNTFRGRVTHFYTVRRETLEMVLQYWRRGCKRIMHFFYTFYERDSSWRRAQEANEPTTKLIK